MEMENAPSSLTLAHDFTVRGGSRGSSNSQDLITSEREREREKARTEYACALPCTCGQETARGAEQEGCRRLAVALIAGACASSLLPGTCCCVMGRASERGREEG